MTSIVLGLPVLNGHELTTDCVKHIVETVNSTKDFRLVIVDNASDEPYTTDEFVAPFPVDIIRNDKNKGFYFPIKQLRDAYPDADIVAVMHNDLFMWEKGWDDRLADTFDNEAIGVVGVCGSAEIDPAGGRGGGTMCNFRGEKGQLQEHTGKKVTGIEPALILDSMFMAFWSDVIDLLAIDENIPLAHFVDKLLPLRALSHGFQTVVLGIEVDHMGGQTLVAEPRFESDARQWCLGQNLPIVNNDGGLTLYLEAELRFKVECANFIPSKILEDGRIHQYRHITTPSR